MNDLKNKILVIEDDIFLRKIIVQKLLKAGYSVIEAINGEEGFKVVKDKKPDLVLLDLILPGIDGFEVLSRIKSDSELSQIPVIVLSNLGEASDREKGMKIGAADYLIKAHLTPGEIVDRVSAILQKK